MAQLRKSEETEKIREGTCEARNCFEVSNAIAMAQIRKNKKIRTNKGGYM